MGGSLLHCHHDPIMMIFLYKGIIQGFIIEGGQK